MNLSLKVCKYHASRQSMQVKSALEYLEWTHEYMHGWMTDDGDIECWSRLQTYACTRNYPFTVHVHHLLGCSVLIWERRICTKVSTRSVHKDARLRKLRFPSDSLTHGTTLEAIASTSEAVKKKCCTVSMCLTLSLKSFQSRAQENKLVIDSYCFSSSLKITKSKHHTTFGNSELQGGSCYQDAFLHLIQLLDFLRRVIFWQYGSILLSLHL